MKAAYTPLPRLRADESENKRLVDSYDDETGHENSDSPESLSVGTIRLVYMLCLLAVAFAIINCVATMYAVCFTHKLPTSVEALPRPDIFVGLPKERNFHHTGNDHAHSHNHTHAACKLF